MTGADHLEWPLTENTKQRARTGIATAFSVRKKVKRKKDYFFHGEVFFLLTGPLMGDPMPCVGNSNPFARSPRFAGKAGTCF